MTYIRRIFIKLLISSDIVLKENRIFVHKKHTQDSARRSMYNDRSIDKIIKTTAIYRALYRGGIHTKQSPMKDQAILVNNSYEYI